ncbi:hypothetical protein BDP27DRAFT_1434915 [Rhodocollybia butyracea]|uniref:Uncharacterized protein n=1 Tax=Rhodocollybia butyracea TaxID=206335 RepID=A0A9P5P6H5_9AGAR|nr:hypothetical protein BDP27DRAFT_1434915 [Rhodocollybia butyracea]
MSYSTSFVMKPSNMAELSLKLPRVPLPEGKSNTEEWKDTLIHSLKVHGLEDYVQKEAPEPVGSAVLQGQWKCDPAQVNLPLGGPITLVQSTFEAAGWNRFTEDPKALYKLIQRVIPSVSSNATGDMVTELGAVMALIDICPPPAKLTPSDGDKAQMEDLCMRLGGSVKLEPDLGWACSFLSAVKAGFLTQSLELDALHLTKTYPRLRPNATRGLGGWAFTMTNLGEALVTRAPTGGRSQFKRPGVTNVGAISSDSLLGCQAFGHAWYYGLTLHGEADLRKWWALWINLRRNSHLPGSTSTQATGSQVTPIPPLGPSRHFTGDDSMRLALSYYLRATTPLLSFTEYSARQHIATLIFASGITLVEDGDIGVHEGAYLAQTCANWLDLLDPATYTSYWHGGPFTGPGADLLAVTFDGIEEAIKSYTLTGVGCMICFLYAVCSTRHRKLFYDNRPENLTVHLGKMDHDNPYVGLIHAISEPRSTFTLWEQSVDLNLQRIYDWQVNLPPTTGGFTTATNILDVGGPVCDIMRQYAGAYLVTDRVVPPLRSYFTL